MKRLLIGIIVGSSMLLGGCAGHAERYRQGLQWHLDNEAAKKKLNDQGFPQYTDNF